MSSGPMASAFHSPSKANPATLQRSNATHAPLHRHFPDGVAQHARSPRKESASSSRQEFIAHRPASPGKENLAFSTGKASPIDQAFHIGAKESHLSRARSPEREPTNVKPRARSVSPSKALRLLGKGRSNHIEEVPTQQREVPRSRRQIDHEFVEMLNGMQVSTAMMHKLMSLDTRVKESMLKGQATLSMGALHHLSDDHRTIDERWTKERSSGSLVDPIEPEKTSSGSLARPFGRSTSGESSGSFGRPASGRSKSALGMHANASSASLVSTRSRSSSFSKDGMPTTANASYYATMLKATDSSRLDVVKVKKMRAILSSESPAWLEEFFDEAGYQAMLMRLKELMALEWREEQHDDQLLHELLRCFVALTSTECGRQVLQSSSPSPFVELSDLLFSEKRPGELTTRKLMVDVLTLLVDLAEPEIEARNGITEVGSQRVSSPLLAQLHQMPAIPCHFTLLITLMHNVRDPNHEAIVDFISASHTPRPFKAYVTELLNINRDYFWVFCHSSNRFWALSDVNVEQAQGPKVPGGMTGGVEFEAMAYLTAHMRLINQVGTRLDRLASDRSMPDLAKRFHHLLFASGFERLLTITRKASQSYYQTLHLELARYFDLCRRAGFGLPVELETWQAVPQLLPSLPLLPSESTYKIAEQNVARPTAPAALPPPLPSKTHLTTSQGNAHLLFAPPQPLRTRSHDGNTGTLVGDAVRKWESSIAHARPAAQAHHVDGRSSADRS